MWWCLAILRGPGVVVFGHPEGAWCGVFVLRGPGVFGHHEGTWCGGVWPSWGDLAWCGVWSS